MGALRLGRYRGKVHAAALLYHLVYVTVPSTLAMPGLLTFETVVIRITYMVITSSSGDKTSLRVCRSPRQPSSLLMLFGI